jgi:16S rRNA (guanine527-N7)-methyltransferase
MKRSQENSLYAFEALAKVLTIAAQEIGIEIGDREIRSFLAYHRELLVWSRRMNLVSQKSLNNVPIKHFIDSLTAVPCIENPKGSLLDIGAGAGFPGIPLKIALLTLQVTLVEASHRKGSFLKQVVRILGLQEIQVVTARAEQLLADHAFQGAFDYVISRATFKLPEYLSRCSGFLSPTGMLIAMKGPSVEPELETARFALQEAGLKLTSQRTFRLPILGAERKILIFQKA